jgi:TetR/AcrR family transcriptional regulator, fatty acid metabolism regulator protein
MRTRGDGDAGSATFTQSKRREQLVDCAIDAVVALGFHGTSVAQVAQRAGVSKGVVTYHFAAKDDLIFAVVARIFESITAALENALDATSPATFVADYINAWVEYYRVQTRYMLAISEIWSNFRDDNGGRHFGPQAVAGELGVVQHVLEYGQEQGILGRFDARVMAVSIKAALDALLDQLAADPELDLAAYGAELVTMFERAARADL